MKDADMLALADDLELRMPHEWEMDVIRDSLRAAARPSPAGPVDREAIKRVLIDLHRQIGEEHETICKSQPNNLQNQMILAAKRNSIQQAINAILALLQPAAGAGEPVAWRYNGTSGWTYLESISGEESRFRYLWQPLYATPAPSSRDLASGKKAAREQAACAFMRAGGDPATIEAEDIAHMLDGAKDGLTADSCKYLAKRIRALAAPAAVVTEDQLPREQA